MDSGALPVGCACTITCTQETGTGDWDCGRWECSMLTVVLAGTSTRQRHKHKFGCRCRCRRRISQPGLYSMNSGMYLYSLLTPSAHDVAYSQLTYKEKLTRHTCRRRWKTESACTARLVVGVLLYYPPKKRSPTPIYIPPGAWCVDTMMHHQRLHPGF